MDDKLKQNWEQVISSTINSDAESRKDAFHNIFVAKATAILGSVSSSLRGAQTTADASGVDASAA